MPTINPLIPDLAQADFTIAPNPPTSAPGQIKSLWFDSQTRTLYLATGTNDPADWQAIQGGGAGADFDLILVSDDQVLTDGNNVLYVE
ncbi:hypothetical protein BST81_13720 [Leptolyngbya sp. 'hensonii']|uniref:hypothetical protein n=1 Tax=Leptolyngbya sp. 'hensonii' TaxID=1922337 RepID=UPI00094FD9E1|nr:hypothetical protein [Leptolyngbya sp. 'hensonii']OLP18078.1 hypothetical protein BST81_13720 [Leptolyngbya sp. 'hensonii']